MWDRKIIKFTSMLQFKNSGGKNRKQLIALLATSFIFKLIVFATTGLNSKSYLSPDSYEYLKLGKNFFKSYIHTNDNFLALSMLRTPGYPLLISIIGHNRIWMVIIFQILISLVISLVVYFMAKNLFGKKIAILALIFSLVDTSLFTETFALLTEVLFTLMITLGVFYLNKYLTRNASIANLAISSILISFSILVRPIGILILAALAISTIFARGKLLKSLAVIFISTLLVFLGWSMRNYSEGQLFKLSTIESNNLLNYEASGALAISKNISLDQAQKIESDLLISSLGASPTIAEISKYQERRAIEIILNNKISIIKLHLIGVAKLMLGPGQGEFIKAISKGERTSAKNFLEISLIYFMALITFISFVFFVIGLARFFNLKTKNDFLWFLVIVFFIFLLGSSGAQAYARFRVPLNPMISMFAALGLNFTFEKCKLFSKSLGR